MSRKISTTSCDTVITTTLTFRPVVEAFDEDVTLNIGDSATINLLINDNLGSFGGRTTMLPSGVYYYVLHDAAPNRKQLDEKILLLR